MPHPIFPYIVTIIILSCSASQITERTAVRGHGSNWDTVVSACLVLS